MKTCVRWGLLGLWGLVFGGCAAVPFTPGRIDCHALGLAPVNATQRLDFPSRGFSILPPQGEHWCIFYTDSDGVQFFKNSFGGRVIEKRPEIEEAAHTFLAASIAIQTEEKVESYPDLRAFFERMIVGGASLSPRYRLLGSKTDPDNSLGAACLRYDLIWEERDNPRVPGFLLISTHHGYLCRHPHSVRLVHLFYSERRTQGAPSRMDALKHEVEPLVRSVVFMMPG